MALAKMKLPKLMKQHKPKAKRVLIGTEQYGRKYKF